MQVRTATQDRKLSKRTITATLLILLAIPVTIWLGIWLLNDRSYYLVSLAIIILSMVPFALVFEGRKPQSREMVVIAVLVGIGVVGRAAFFMLPQFKPVVAIVIIAGVCFGGEAGFIVGALTAFISNFIFGQGPWTPWQMFALGIIGFLAGVLFKKGILKKKLLPLCIYGALSSFIIYGLLLDASSVTMYTPTVTWPALLASWAVGLPFNAVLAVATVIFLLLLAKPMTEKLDRIKKKYGMMEP